MLYKRAIINPCGHLHIPGYKARVSQLLKKMQIGFIYIFFTIFNLLNSFIR